MTLLIQLTEELMKNIDFSLSDFVDEVLNFILVNLCNVANSVDILDQIIVRDALWKIEH